MKHEHITAPEDDYSLGNATPAEILCAISKMMSDHSAALLAQGKVEAKYHFPTEARTLIGVAVKEANHAHRRREWEIRNAN